MRIRSIHWREGGGGGVISGAGITKCSLEVVILWRSGALDLTYCALARRSSSCHWYSFSLPNPNLNSSLDFWDSFETSTVIHRDLACHDHRGGKRW